MIDKATIPKSRVGRTFKALSAMDLTHLFQFVKFRETSEYFHMELPYPSANLDPEEEELRIRWCKYVRHIIEIRK